MEAANTSWVIPESSLDFAFGFDDPKYSDRTLQLQIIDRAHTDGDNCSDLVRNVKRRRRCKDLRIAASTAPPPRMKTIHINSLILAARSPFFLKLFSNGMLESEQKHVTLRIETSEEASLMNLLRHAYNNNNVPTTLHALLDLLVIADKFEVASCLRDSIRALRNLQMTCESASLYLDLSPSLLMSPVVQPLINEAKQFLVANFNDLDKFKEEVLKLPLASIQAILSSDDLGVSSECVVYDFVLTWARKHYPDAEERRRILKTHLLHLVRFPFMTTTKLTKEVQTCSDIDPEFANKIVTRALVFKAENLHERHCLAAEEDNTISRQFVERAYRLVPIKGVELEAPHQQTIVYLDLKRDELGKIFSSGTGGIGSQSFHLGGQRLSLITVTHFVEQTNQRWFHLVLNKWGSGKCRVKYEVALRKKPSEEFGSWATGSVIFPESKCSKMLYGVPCTGFIEGDSPYFINDVLHIRADFTMLSV